MRGPIAGIVVSTYAFRLWTYQDPNQFTFDAGESSAREAVALRPSSALASHLWRHATHRCGRRVLCTEYLLFQGILSYGRRHSPLQRRIVRLGGHSLLVWDNSTERRIRIRIRPHTLLRFYLCRTFSLRSRCRGAGGAFVCCIHASAPQSRSLTTYHAIGASDGSDER